VRGLQCGFQIRNPDRAATGGTGDDKTARGAEDSRWILSPRAGEICARRRLTCAAGGRRRCPRRDLSSVSGLGFPLVYCARAWACGCWAEIWTQKKVQFEPVDAR
jgi:hypothetical protein